ncbi:phospholipase D-like protein [Cellulomonas sp. PhB150]|nr:phospholipase D-like protein [Cellulomonas sp. PhB150]
MQWFWLLVWWFVLLTYLVVIFHIVTDLFRDHELSGWWKALWLIGLVAVPFLVALAYVIARGWGMSEREGARLVSAGTGTATYVREVPGPSPTADLAKAKALLDAGVIDSGEFATLRAKALA